MNKWELQKYELSVNKRGQVVRVVKELLHRNPRSNYHTDGTDVFDTKLYLAVVEFQQTARLRNTNGSVDKETWAALGIGLQPAQIDIISIHDSKLRLLLTRVLDDSKPPSKEKIETAWKSLQKCRSQVEKDYQRNFAELNRKYSAENQLSVLGDVRKLVVTAGAGIAWEISKAAGKIVLKRIVGGAVVGTLIQTAAEVVYMTGAWFEELWIIKSETDEALADCFESNEEMFQLSFRTNSNRNNISSWKDNPRYWNVPMW